MLLLLAGTENHIVVRLCNDWQIPCLFQWVIKWVIDNWLIGQKKILIVWTARLFDCVSWFELLCKLIDEACDWYALMTGVFDHSLCSFCNVYCQTQNHFILLCCCVSCHMHWDEYIYGKLYMVSQCVVYLFFQPLHGARHLFSFDLVSLWCHKIIKL